MFCVRNVTEDAAVDMNDEAMDWTAKEMAGLGLGLSDAEKDAAKDCW